MEPFAGGIEAEDSEDEAVLGPAGALFVVIAVLVAPVDSELESAGGGTAVSVGPLK
jgi:hypothetical protein